jgi:hypothetical protein
MLFLKGKYYLLEGGKALRRPCKAPALRMRRKLRKFKALVEAGRMGCAASRSVRSAGALRSKRTALITGAAG